MKVLKGVEMTKTLSPKQRDESLATLKARFERYQSRHQGLESRKERKPKTSAVDMAASMGIELLAEEEYFTLQKLGEFDSKTSSWVKTPDDIRKPGGALYSERRYDRIFTGHNGAQSYYRVRGFRGSPGV